MIFGVIDTLTILVIVRTRIDGHCLRIQLEIVSESDCLLGRFERVLWISDSQAR